MILLHHVTRNNIKFWIFEITEKSVHLSPYIETSTETSARGSRREEDDGHTYAEQEVNDDDVGCEE